MISKEEIRDWFSELQNSICNELERVDSAGKFEQDVWERPGGGGGTSRVMVNGKIIEKGGVNFSAVWGKTPAQILASLDLEDNPIPNFFATGVSVVIHPANPMVPIIHMNVRYFEMSHGAWWFGGGIDLTPHYIDKGDAAYFHRQLKNVCDKYDSSYYPEFKKWADEYFFIKHRNETRGVGGIFFDYLKATETLTKEDRFEFVKDVGSAFAPIYTHFMNKNGELPYSDREKQWQYLRRGRYAEFNLVWDRGTKFGLETNGRTESILMSLPPHAIWEYNHTPESKSREEETLKLLKQGIDWI